MTKNKQARLMALQLMGEDPTPPVVDPPTPPVVDPPTPPVVDPPTPPAPTDPPKPFATFPDEKSLMSRIDREAKKQQADFLKSLGIEDEGSLKAMLEAEKQRKEDELSETEKLQNKLSTLENERTQALTRAETIARTAEAKQLAAELGINPTRINHFIKLADISDIKVNDDGSVDLETMRTRFDGLIKELPEFKGQVTAPQGGTEFGGTNNQKPTITKEWVKTATKEELAANIEEVRKVMGQ